MPPSPWMRTAGGERATPTVRTVRTVRVGTGTIIGFAGVLLAVLVLQNAFVAGQRILGWAAASTATAVFVAPLVTWLGRWIPRVAAVLLTFLVIAVAAGALIFGAFDDLDREVSALQRDAPSAAERIEDRDDEIGAAMRDLRLTDRVEVFLDEVDERIGSGSDALAANALTVPVYFVNVILTIFLLIYGPGIVRGGLSLVDDDARRARLDTVLQEAVLRGRRTMAALFAQGAVFGLGVGGVAWALDLPAPVVLGLVAGVAATIPDFGILLGVLPMLALTGGLRSGRTAVAVLAAALVLQAFEALHVRRRVDRWGVEVGPTVVWIVVLLGYTLHGPGMALFGVAYAVFGLAVVDELAADRPDPEAVPADRHVGGAAQPP